MCLCLASYFLPISLSTYPLPLSLSLSVAAVLVMAVCPWCKLAVESQVAHMTVIDVQVFNCSHTETLESHTLTTCTLRERQIQTDAQYTCVHSSVVHMHTQITCKLSCTFTIMHINSVFLCCCCESVFNTETGTTENLCIQLPAVWRAKRIAAFSVR